MTKKPISYKFIPAVATMLCVAPAAQALNWGFSINLPLPVARPCYVPCPSVQFGFGGSFARSYSTSALVASIEDDFHKAAQAMYYARSGDIRELEHLMTTITRNWFSWAQSYRDAHGINRSQLEYIKTRASQIAYRLRDLQCAHVHLRAHEYDQLHANLRNIVALVTSCGCYCSDDMRMIGLYLSEIQHILAVV